MALVAPHCDIVERLNDVPPSARVRGLYFKSVLNVLRQLGRLPAFEEYFPAERRSSLTFYPLGDYLLQLAVAGAVVRAPAELHRGIHEITRQNASAFATSLLGRVLTRILDRDPVQLRIAADSEAPHEAGQVRAREARLVRSPHELAQRCGQPYSTPAARPVG